MSILKCMIDVWIWKISKIMILSEFGTLTSKDAWKIVIIENELERNNGDSQTKVMMKEVNKRYDKWYGKMGLSVKFGFTLKPKKSSKDEKKEA